MNESMISKIAKAKRYAEEPERIQFTHFEAKFRDDKDVHTVRFEKGEWYCTCRFFHDWGDCEHIMAMKHILGVTIPAIHRDDIPDGVGISKGVLIPAGPAIPAGHGKSSYFRVRGIRITEEPLTIQNLTVIVSALTELYTKCWLIARGRSAELIEYSQTHHNRFTEEAKLVLTRITYNSPFNMEWKLDASAQGVMVALATGIDAIVQVPQRLENAELENRAKELSMELKELETQSAIADKEQARQISAQKAELEKQAALLEIEKQRLEVMAKRLDVEKKRIDYALEIAGAMVEIMRPDADGETKAIFLQTLIPNLLQLGNGKGLQLALIESRSGEKEMMTKDD